MNNEPVAWFYHHPDETGKFMCADVKAMEGIEKRGYIVTPLYTHPVKELTDEEIINCWDGVDPPEECWITDEQRIMFARAILRKAQEK
jgi:hypothetical protein